MLQQAQDIKYQGNHFNNMHKLQNIQETTAKTGTR